MTTPLPPSFLRGVGRGLSRRCWQCGSGGLFRHWTRMVDDCPRCGLHFERVEGYWLGSIALNLTVTLGLFLAVFVGILVVTWPDVPWTGVLVTVVAFTALFPILFHPASRTLWVALERHVHTRSHPQ